MGTIKSSFLAIACVVLAFGALAPADSDVSGETSSQSTAAASPDDVFRARGLERLGFWLVLPEESEIHTAVASLKASKVHITDDVVTRRDAGFDLRADRQQLDDLEAQFKDINQQVTDSINRGKSLNQKDVKTYNNWVGDNNMLIGKRTEIEIAIDKKMQAMEDLKKKEETIADSRSRFINLTMEFSGKAEDLTAQYAALAKDKDVAAAIDRANQTAVPKIRLGPSGVCKDDIQFIKQCAKQVMTGAVPVNTSRGGDPSVEPVLNEKVTLPMVWDSGASLVTITSKTADALGLTVSEQSPSIELQVADGRTFKAKVVILDSIRLGAFTVKNVECAVLPEDYKGAANLLGDSFQRHFSCRLDQQEGQLELTPIDSGVIRGKVLKTKAAIIAPSESDSSNP